MTFSGRLHTPAFYIVEQAYSPGVRMTPHAHEHPSLSLVIAGMLRERMGRAAEVIRPLSISLMPAGVAHDDEFGPDGARLLSVHLSDWAASAEVGGTVEEWRWLHGGPGV